MTTQEPIAVPATLRALLFDDSLPREEREHMLDDIAASVYHQGVQDGRERQAQHGTQQHTLNTELQDKLHALAGSSQQALAERLEAARHEAEQQRQAHTHAIRGLRLGIVFKFLY